MINWKFFRSRDVEHLATTWPGFSNTSMVNSWKRFSQPAVFWTLHYHIFIPRGSGKKFPKANIYRKKWEVQLLCDSVASQSSRTSKQRHCKPIALIDIPRDLQLISDSLGVTIVSVALKFSCGEAWLSDVSEPLHLRFAWSEFESAYGLAGLCLKGFEN